MSVISHQPASISFISRRMSAFTLVELLVVIGIIALLISILLPSLNRARQQAYLIDCQSRMRQMGQAIQMYVTDNKGALPGLNQPWPAAVWDEWTLPATITRVLGGAGDTEDTTGVYYGHVGVQFLSPIFTDHDVDTTTQWGIQHPNNYAFNPAIFTTYDWGLQGADPHTSNDLPYVVKATKIKHSSEVVAAWDTIVGTLDQYGGSAYKVPAMIQDENAEDCFYASNRFNLGGSNIVNGVYDPDVNIGRWGAPNIVAKGVDTVVGTVDFRHIGGKTCNVLFLDGHAESRQYGSLKVREFMYNWTRN